MGYHALNLNEIRIANHGQQRKSPFEHQVNAFQALSKVFEFNGAAGKGAPRARPVLRGKTSFCQSFVANLKLTKTV